MIFFSRHDLERLRRTFYLKLARNSFEFYDYTNGTAILAITFENSRTRRGKILYENISGGGGFSDISFIYIVRRTTYI